MEAVVSVEHLSKRYWNWTELGIVAGMLAAAAALAVRLFRWE